MCGRYNFTAAPKDLVDLFGLTTPPAIFNPRFNIAPRQKVPTVVAAPGDPRKRKLGQIIWGFLPSFADSSEFKTRPINARSETVASSGMFRDSFARKRCLLPATGFYEWDQSSKPKQGFHIHFKYERTFAMAAIWECWTDGENEIYTVCSLTTQPNEVLSPFHDRMPVIIRPEDFTTWLAEDTPIPKLKSLLKPYPAEEMEAYPVSNYVNKATNEGAACLDRVDLNPTDSVKKSQQKPVSTTFTVQPSRNLFDEEPGN